jgi:hypothetical protein
MGADTVRASPDLGTACAENRHFVDYEYLKSIMGEYELKRSLVATPCSLLTGRGLFHLIGIAINCN